MKEEKKRLETTITELNAIIESLEAQLPTIEPPQPELTVQEKNQIRREKKNALLNAMTTFV